MNKYIFKGPDILSEADVPWTETLDEDFFVIVYKDKFPVTEGHLLFVPKYNNIEILNFAFEQAICYGKKMVANTVWDGFNIGINYGEAAGQTVMWPHIHLIPRRVGDVEDPVGGVRNTIPGKGNYKNEQN
jgi:diadenosine tetraphosphate (Ap4A) HIT family hydrolase